MDMILTGREVSATKARSMGLVNRIVPEGQARMSAENLARDLALSPQMCMRNDRRSVIESWGLSVDDAMRREFELGSATIDSGETEKGATRFRDGEGRH